MQLTAENCRLCQSIGLPLKKKIFFFSSFFLFRCLSFCFSFCQNTYLFISSFSLLSFEPSFKPLTTLSFIGTLGSFLCLRILSYFFGFISPFCMFLFPLLVFLSSIFVLLSSFFVFLSREHLTPHYCQLVVNIPHLVGARLTAGWVVSPSNVYLKRNLNRANLNLIEY